MLCFSDEQHDFEDIWNLYYSHSVFRVEYFLHHWIQSVIKVSEKKIHFISIFWAFKLFRLEELLALCFYCILFTESSFVRFSAFLWCGQWNARKKKLFSYLTKFEDSNWQQFLTKANVNGVTIFFSWHHPKSKSETIIITFHLPTFRLKAQYYSLYCIATLWVAYHWKWSISIIYRL